MATPYLPRQGIAQTHSSLHHPTTPCNTLHLTALLNHLSDKYGNAILAPLELYPNRPTHLRPNILQLPEAPSTQQLRRHHHQTTHSPPLSLPPHTTIPQSTRPHKKRAGSFLSALSFYKRFSLIWLNPNYLIIFVTTPAPTVWPPSRIAKRKPSFIAIGCINETVIVILSPGITISVPSFSWMEPVTSVVLK